MLVLARAESESIVIDVPPGDGARITLSVVKFMKSPRGNVKVKLGFDAPKEVKILRSELEQQERAASRDKVTAGKDGD